MARRLNSIELLPPEVDEDIADAKAMVFEERLPQEAIRIVLNARLLRKGIGEISSSAFNRWVLALRENKPRKLDTHDDQNSIELLPREVDEQEFRKRVDELTKGQDDPLMRLTTEILVGCDLAGKSTEYDMLIALLDRFGCRKDEEKARRIYYMLLAWLCFEFPDVLDGFN